MSESRVLVVLMGTPGSGKSTVAQRLSKEKQVQVLGCSFERLRPGLTAQ